ncbi:mechanosensitive ion channel [Candidatus Woesearchaeota archaeon]|nr:mechanosensitive ion channel [Candidatus Woesearchaeota archaeon]
MATGAFFQQLFADVLTDAVIALIILLIGFIISRIVGKLVQGIFHELELEALLGKIRIRFGAEEFIGTLVSYAIYGIAVIMALNSLGITRVVMNVLAGIAIVTILVSLILTLSDYVPNLIAGIMLRQKRAIAPGNMVKVKGLEGKVLHAGLLETRVETRQKDLVYIPNSFITKSGPLRVKRK